MSEKTVNLTPYAKHEQMPIEYLKEQTQEFYGTLKKGDWFGEKGRRIGGELRDYLLSVALAIRPPKETMPSMNEKELDNAKLAIIVQLRVGMVAGAADGKLGMIAFEKIAKKLGMKLRKQDELGMRLAKPIAVREITKEKIFIPVVENLEKYLDSKIKRVEGKIRAEAEKFARENVRQSPAYTIGEGAACASEWEIEQKTKDEVKRRTAAEKVGILNNDPRFMALQLQTRAAVVKKILAGQSIAGASITVSWKTQRVEDHTKELKSRNLGRAQAKQELERVLNLPENRKLCAGLDLDAGTVAESAVSKVY